MANDEAQEQGARIGDMFMSLFHTCELNKANAFDYLTELFSHPGEFASHHERFMPRNYRQTLADLLLRSKTQPK